jgi:hypothetical protein
MKNSSYIINTNVIHYWFGIANENQQKRNKKTHKEEKSSIQSSWLRYWGFWVLCYKQSWSEREQNPIWFREFFIKHELISTFFFSFSALLYSFSFVFYFFVCKHLELFDIEKMNQVQYKSQWLTFILMLFVTNKTRIFHMTKSQVNSNNFLGIFFIKLKTYWVHCNKAKMLFYKIIDLHCVQVFQYIFSTCIQTSSCFNNKETTTWNIENFFTVFLQ